jgi:hypothetical protein
MAPDPVLDEVPAVVEAGIVDNTRRAYRSDFGHFGAPHWGGAQSAEPCSSLPTLPPTRRVGATFLVRRDERRIGRRDPNRLTEADTRRRWRRAKLAVASGALGNGILTAETARVFRAGEARKTPDSRAETDTASANPRKYRGPSQTRKTTEFARTGWWAMQGSNLRPLPCEGSALPLS